MIKIAIQKKGRLSQESKKFLAKAGLEFEQDSKLLALACRNMPVKIIQVRDDDIPKYVKDSSVDFGIVGLDVLNESGIKTKIVKKLGFCLCKLVIAVPKSSDIKSIKSLVGKKIATSYPRILQDFLTSKNIKAKIIYVRGSVEVAPYLEAADAVCDITQTGSTLKQFNLIPLKTVLKSQAVLIKSPMQLSNSLFKINP